MQKAKGLPDVEGEIRRIAELRERLKRGMTGKPPFDAAELIRLSRDERDAQILHGLC